MNSYFESIIHYCFKYSDFILFDIAHFCVYNWIKNSIHLRRLLQFLQIIASSNSITDSLIHFVSTYHDNETKVPIIIKDNIIEIFMFRFERHFVFFEYRNFRFEKLSCLNQIFIFRFGRLICLIQIFNFRNF